jgi:hypothetical protein
MTFISQVEGENTSFHRYKSLNLLSKNPIVDTWHQCCYIVFHRTRANAVMSDEVEAEIRGKDLEALRDNRPALMFNALACVG